MLYQIYPRSFCDTNGDGVGDLEGIRRHLDHLVDLGVDGLWLSPFYRSPMADFGYDVSDYCDVDPLFGSLDDFDRLLAEAHDRGLRVVIDWVPNHTSDRHPWFVESRSSRDSPKRSWYVWRDGTPDTPPTSLIAAFTGESAWQWDEATSQWYLHRFLPEQPDLNWRNPAVVAAMHDTLRFWLDRGVDGFRVDVVHLLGRDPDTPDQEDDPATHAIVRGIRRVLDEYDGDRMMVGEVYILSTARVARFYGDGDELHLAFNFPPLYAPFEAPAWRRRVERVIEELGPRQAWPTWVLSNHDNPRHRTRYGGSEARARAAAVLLLTLRGTPFLYAGEELGLDDAHVPPDRVIDPGGRDGCRAPIPWERGPHHGWGVTDPWLPWPPEPDERAAATLASDPESILALYRRLLTLRHEHQALQLGELELLDAPEGVLMYERQAGGERWRVIVNFTDAPIAVPGGGVVAVASHTAGEGDAYEGSVPGPGAVVMNVS